MEKLHITVTEQPHGRQASILLGYPHLQITLRQTLEIIADVFKDIPEEHIYLNTAGVGDLMIYELKKNLGDSEYSDCTTSKNTLRQIILWPLNKGLISLFVVKLAAQDLGGLDVADEIIISSEQGMFALSRSFQSPNG